VEPETLLLLLLLLVDMMSDVMELAFHGMAGAVRAGSLYDGVRGRAGGKMNDMTDAACCCSC
jgi:hypothetical protein